MTCASTSQTYTYIHSIFCNSVLQESTLWIPDCCLLMLPVQTVTMMMDPDMAQQNVFSECRTVWIHIFVKLSVLSHFVVWNILEHSSRTAAWKIDRNEAVCDEKLPESAVSHRSGWLPINSSYDCSQAAMHETAYERIKNRQSYIGSEWIPNGAIQSLDKIEDRF